MMQFEVCGRKGREGINSEGKEKKKKKENEAQLFVWI